MKRTPDPKSKKEFKINVNFFNLLQFDETKLQRIERKLKKKRNSFDYSEFNWI